MYVPCCCTLLQTVVTHWRICKCSYKKSICTIYFLGFDEDFTRPRSSRRGPCTREIGYLHDSTCRETFCSRNPFPYPSALRPAAYVWVSSIWGLLRTYWNAAVTEGPVFDFRGTTLRYFEKMSVTLNKYLFPLLYLLSPYTSTKSHSHKSIIFFTV